MGRRLYYGWIIAGACFAITFTLGEALWSYGVFFKPLQQEFGWSRAVTSSGNTAFLIAYAFSCTVLGSAADRYPPRNVLIISSILTGTGFYLCSIAGDIWQFRIFMAIAGFGAGATWPVPISVIQRWFIRRRGMLLAIVITGIGLGGMIFPPLINYFIESYGIRNTYVILAAIYFTIISAAAMVMVHSPEKKGLKPYGSDSAGAKLAASGILSPSKMLSTRELLLNVDFIYLSVGYMVGLSAINIVFTHMIPAATDIGMSPAFAASALGILGLTSIPGRLLVGLIADKIGWTWVLFYCNVGVSLSVVWLAYTGSPWMMQVFVIAYGFFHGARAPTMAGAMGYLFGTRSLGMLIGVTSGIGNLVAAFSPYIAGYIFDRTQSYFIAFLLAAVLYLMVAVLALGLKPISWRLPVLNRFKTSKK